MSLFSIPRASAGLTAAAAAVFSCASACTTVDAYRVVFPSPTGAEPRPVGAVLMVLPAAETQTLADDSPRKTGFFLNEFYEPYVALVDAGYVVTIATLSGQRPAVDPESLEEKYWKARDEREHALRMVESHPELLAPLPLENLVARAADFQALVVPGGQAVMVDLLDNPVLHGLLREFGASHRPVGLICHAPAILTRMVGEPNPFAGRRVTSVSRIEEWYIETFVMHAKAQVRGIASRLDEAGLRHEAAFPGKPKAVRDCNLVTSQNPYSSAVFNTLFLAALDDWRRGGRCLPREE